MTDTGGNPFRAISSERFQAKNPFIELNHLSTVATDARDIGIFASYGTGSVYNYAGLYRDATTKRWTSFSSTAIPDYNGGTGTSALSGFAKAPIEASALYSATLTVSSTASITGNITSLASVLASNGSVSSPSYSFTSETGSGWYRVASGNLGLSIASTLLFDVTAARVKLPVCGLYAPDTGTASGTAPAYAFTNATLTGHRLSTGAIIFSIAGSDVLTLASGAVVTAQQLVTTAAGTVTTPDVSFGDGVGTSGLYLTGGGTAGATVNVTAYGTRAAYFNSTGMVALQLSTGTITHSGAITVSQAFAMGSNNLTTSGTISTGTLTSAAASITVSKPIDAGSNNITTTGTVSTGTLTGASTIAVTQSVDMGANVLSVNDIRGSANVVSFNNGAGYIVANNIRKKVSTKSGAYTITAADFNVEFTAAATCTLPTASTVVGQEFLIYLSAAGPLVISTTDKFFNSTGPTSITIAREDSFIKLTPTADGQYWLF